MRWPLFARTDLELTVASRERHFVCTVLFGWAVPNQTAPIGCVCSFGFILYYTCMWVSGKASKIQIYTYTSLPLCRQPPDLNKHLRPPTDYRPAPPRPARDSSSNSTSSHCSRGAPTRCSPSDTGSPPSSQTDTSHASRDYRPPAYSR